MIDKMEKKTLKGFRCQAENCCDRDNCKNQLIRVDSLKEEARKWVKRFEDQPTQDVVYFIKHFFNLDEEEEDSWYCEECGKEMKASEKGVFYNEEGYCSDKCIEVRKTKE